MLPWQDLLPFCSAICFWCVREAACFCRVPLGLAGFHWHKRTSLLLCSDEGFSTCAGESRSTTRGGAPLRGGVRARHAQRAAISGDGGDLFALPPPRRQPAGGMNPFLDTKGPRLRHRLPPRRQPARNVMVWALSQPCSPRRRRDQHRRRRLRVSPSGAKAASEPTDVKIQPSTSRHSGALISHQAEKK